MHWQYGFVKSSRHASICERIGTLARELLYNTNLIHRRIRLRGPQHPCAAPRDCSIRVLLFVVDFLTHKCKILIIGSGVWGLDVT